MTDWNKVTAFWDLTGAPPCAHCGGAIHLDRFDPDSLKGVVKCRSCGHSFEVVGDKPKEQDDLHQG